MQSETEISQMHYVHLILLFFTFYEGFLSSFFGVSQALSSLFSFEINIQCELACDIPCLNAGETISQENLLQHKRLLLLWCFLSSEGHNFQHH